jgi:hypothetical protein
MPLDGTGFDPVYEALNRAEANIRRYGWRKSMYGERGRPSCVIGAIQQAVADMGLNFEQCFRLRWDACKCYGEAIGVSQVEVWNDRPERMPADVLDGFALAKARALDLCMAG